MMHRAVVAAVVAVCLVPRAEAQERSAQAVPRREVEIAVEGGFTGPGPAVRIWTDAGGVVRGRVTRRRSAGVARTAAPLSWAAALARLDTLGIWAPPPAPPPVAPHTDTLPSGRVVSYLGVLVCTDGWGAQVTLRSTRAHRTYDLNPCGQPAAETARQEAIVRVVYDLAATAH